jgi:hypothetical protein
LSGQQKKRAEKGMLPPFSALVTSGDGIKKNPGLLFFHGLSATDQFTLSGFFHFHDISAYLTFVGLSNSWHHRPPFVCVHIKYRL